jgi:hypothetical protein
VINHSKSDYCSLSEKKIQANRERNKSKNARFLAEIIDAEPRAQLCRVCSAFYHAAVIDKLLTFPLLIDSHTRDFALFKNQCPPHFYDLTPIIFPKSIELQLLKRGIQR